MESMYNKLVAQETGAKNESSPKANGQVNGATTKVQEQTWVLRLWNPKSLFDGSL